MTPEELEQLRQTLKRADELREMVTRFVCERLGKRVEIARRELAALQIHPNGQHAPERPESPVEPR